MSPSISPVISHKPDDQPKDPIVNPALHQWYLAIKQNTEKQKAAERGEHQPAVLVKKIKKVLDAPPDQKPEPTAQNKPAPQIQPAPIPRDAAKPDNEAAMLFEASLSNLTLTPR